MRGELKIHSFTDPESAVLRYQPWTLVHGGAERELEGVKGRQTAKGVNATIPGVEDRDAAQAMAGAEIWVPRSRLPKPKPGEYYWVDLEGLRVVNVEGVDFGRVSHLFATGANDVLVGGPYARFEKHIRVSLGRPDEMREFWRVWDLLPANHTMVM